MFELNWEDITVGNRVAGDRHEGIVTAVTKQGVTVEWEPGTEAYVIETYTAEQFSEYGFTAYVTL
jgi:hypothetical protein